MKTFEVDFEKLRPTAPHRDGGAVKYRLDVVASSPADVVCSVGGWLYDRVRAGWEVTVLLPQPSDTRPLQILGMHASDLASQMPPASTECAARGLAVSADMFASGVICESVVAGWPSFVYASPSTECLYGRIPLL